MSIPRLLFLLRRSHCCTPTSTGYFKDQHKLLCSFHAWHQDFRQIASYSTGPFARGGGQMQRGLRADFPSLGKICLQANALLIGDIRPFSTKDQYTGVPQKAEESTSVKPDAESTQASLDSKDSQPQPSSTISGNISERGSTAGRDVSDFVRFSRVLAMADRIADGQYPDEAFEEPKGMEQNQRESNPQQTHDKPENQQKQKQKQEDVKDLSASKASDDGVDIVPEADWESIVADKWVTDELEGFDIGQYLGLPRHFLPEVFYESELPYWEGMHPKGGCRGLEDEIAASKADLVFYRKCMHALTTGVLSKDHKKIYIVGPASSGKSITMATAVIQMRALGWLVMYVPEAKQLTTGGTFSKSAVKGYWDTPEIAKLLLHYFIKGNPHRIDQDRSPVSGKTLREVAQPAFEEEAEPGPVVDAFLEVREALRLASNAMIAIDNYQALHLPTGYGEWLSATKRRVLQPEELRVAHSMRFLEQPDLRDGVVLCSAHRSSSFSPRMRKAKHLQLPLPFKLACRRAYYLMAFKSTAKSLRQMPFPQTVALCTIPRMSIEEWTAMADYYSMTGATPTLSDYAIKKAFHSMNGNPKEYRRFASIIATDEEELEESLDDSTKPDLKAQEMQIGH